MRLKQRILIGSSIFIIGALPYLYSILRYSQHNWTPLTYPIQLTPGIIEFPYFKADLNGTYIVSLVFDTMANWQREDCLMGENFPKGSCKNVPQAIHLKWKIMGGSSQVILSGQYHWMGGSGTSNGTQGAWIVWFDAKRNARQKIILNISQDGGELNAAHPRLQVEAHWSYWEKWIMLKQLGFFLLIAACLPALVWTVWPLIFHRKEST